MASSTSQTGSNSANLPGRRGFFGWLTVGMGTLAALVVGIPFVGYLLACASVRPTGYPWAP